jgi:glycerate kinase
VGGSATSDGGAGIAEALGVSLTDTNGAAIGPGPSGLAALERIDISRRDPNLEGVRLVVACDVANPLLGNDGAAQVFGPQKGAGPLEVEAIESALTRFAEVTRRDLDVWLGDLPRAGAAGGAAGGMHALLGAELRDGFEVVSEALEFERQLAGADLLVVGEGRLDRQSLSGKAPIAAARMARREGVRVWAFAGSIDLDRASLQSEGIEVAVDLTERWGNRAPTNAAPSLRQSASEALSRAFGA